MICPNCGNETRRKEVCDICGKPTEFVIRLEYLSTGSSRNPVQTANPHKIISNNLSINPHYPPKERRRSIYWVILVILLTGLVVVEGICLLFLASKVKSIYSDNVSSPSQAAEVDVVTTEFTEPAVPAETAMSVEKIPAPTEAVPAPTAEIPAIPAVSTTVPTEAPMMPTETPTEPEEDVLTFTGAAEPVEIFFDLNLGEDISAMAEDPRPIVSNEPLPEPFPAHDSQYILEGKTASWRFVGWNTEKDGSGISATVGGFITGSLSEGLILYAQWEILPLVESVG